MNRTWRSRAVIIVSFGALLLVYVLLSGQFGYQVTLVGVVRIEEIYLNLFSESKNVRDFEEFKQTVEDAIRGYEQEILELEYRRLDAMEHGDGELARDYDEEISGQEAILEQYKSVKTRELEWRLREIEQSDEFKSDLHDAIVKVAGEEGLSLVLRSDRSNMDILWWAPEIDITENVIEAMRR